MRHDHGYSDEDIELLLPLLNEQREKRRKQIQEGWQWLCAQGLPMAISMINTGSLSLGIVMFQYWRRNAEDFVALSGVKLYVEIGGAWRINNLNLSYEMNTTEAHKAEPTFAAAIAELEAYKRKLEQYLVY